MKKLISLLLSALLCLCFAGCASEQFEYIYAPKELYALVVDNLGNEYKVDISREEGETQKTVTYELEYLATFDEVFVELGLQGLYEKDGTPLSTELYNPQFNNGESVHLSFVGTKVMTKPCGIYYAKKGDRGNNSLELDCDLTFHFNVTVKANKILHDYVTISDVEIPYDNFSCEMQTISADTYNLYDFNDMLGAYYNTDDFEYGHSTKQFLPDGSELNASSDLIQRQTQGDTVYQTKKIHSFDLNAEYGWEIYQYTQLKGTDIREMMSAYGLNETDGVFSAGTHSEGGVYGWQDYMPSQLEVVKYGHDLVYRAGEKDGYLYLSISGMMYTDWYWSTHDITATYIIQGNKVVAWLYEETTTTPHEENYWTDVTYCIPFEGEIELMDESVLEELCALY